MNYRIKTRPKIPRNKYGYLATTSTGGGGSANTSVSNVSTGGSENAKTADKLTKPVTIWGLDFDGSNNVSGLIYIDGEADIKGTTRIDGDVKIGINKRGSLRVDGTIEADGEINIGHHSITAGDINCAKIDSDSLTTGDIIGGSATLSGETKINGRTTLYNTLDLSSNDIVNGKSATFNGTLRSYGDLVTYSVKPYADNKYSLGNSSKRYKNIYGINANVSTLTTDNIYPDTEEFINLNGTVTVEDDFYVGKESHLNDTMIDGTLDVSDNADFEGDIDSKNIYNEGEIITHNLTVTGLAHFFELIIDKIKSVGGAALFTPADGFTIDKVTEIKHDQYNRYRVYWKNTDDEGNVRLNMWLRGDQALCMTFNKATVGTTTDVSNKYYWCYIPWTSNNESTPPTDGYHFIDLVVDESGTPKADGVVNPEIGDLIVMCGHRKYGTETEQEATERGSAIYISAYNGLDNGIKAPFIAQYKGIKTFLLTPYRQSYFDAVGAKFVGNFEITPDLILDIADKVDVHDPYINDDGYWVIWKNGAWFTTQIKAQGNNGLTPYIKDNNWWVGDTDTGIKAQGNNGATPEIINGYWWINGVNTWVKAQGTNGQNGTYKQFLYKASTSTPSKPTISYENQIVTSGWSKTIPTDGYVKYNNTTLTYSGAGTSSTYGGISCRAIPGDRNVNNEFIKDMITFTTNVDNEKITINYITSSEENYDWLYIGKLDIEYTTSTIASNYSARLSGEDFEEWKTITLNIPNKGLHFIEMIYKTDGSEYGGSDSGYYYVDSFSALSLGKIYQTYNDAYWDDEEDLWAYNRNNWSDPIEWNPKGDNGEDAEFYKLYPVNESVVVNSSNVLAVNLLYIIQHIKGNSITSVNAASSGYYIRFKNSYNSTVTNLSYGANPAYSNNSYATSGDNYRTITVQLMQGSTVIDQKVIPVTLLPSATFSIKQATDNSIASITSRVAASETNITGVTNRVTTVEQTASGLTSTVSKLNITGSRINLLPESNLTGRCNNVRYTGSEGNYNTVVKNAFNGMNSYRAYIPVLPYSATENNFKYNGIRWGSDGHKAIKLKINTTYTLSVWAKANVAESWARIEVHKVNSLYGNRVSGFSLGSEIRPTSEWKQYVWEFTTNTDLYEIYIFTYNNRTATSNATTVQDVEFCMPLLTENGITEYSLSPEDKDIVQGNLLDNTNNFTVGGNLVIANGTIGNYGGKSKYIYCNKTNSYTELLLWNFSNSLLIGNKDYVLSFYAKATRGNLLSCIMYSTTASNDSQARYSDNSDGYKNAYYTTVLLSPEWHKVYVHFHTVNLLESEIRVLLRQTNGNDVYVALPKLELGADYTEWTTSVNDYETPSSVSTKIELKAESIELSVNTNLRNTGINIEDGLISLNAKNTVISDNLTVGRLETSGLDATISINDGLMLVYGTNKSLPNIVFGVDDDGYAVLKYYDNDGNLKYNLGPDGIMNTFTETYNRFQGATKFLRIDNGTTINNTFSSVDALSEGTNYYRFIEGYKMIGNLKQYKISGTSIASTYHLSYYNSTAMTTRPTGTRILDGWYFNGLMSPTVNDKYKIVEAVKMTAGKQTAKMNVYAVYSGNLWRLTDTNFNTVTNKTPQDYLTLTGLNSL